MSIKGIDTQMMITRAAELTNEASVQVRKGDMSQEFLAIHQKAVAEHDQQSVKGPQKAEQADVKLDQDGSGSGAASSGGGRGSGQREDDRPDPLDQLVPGGQNTIDIKI